MENSFTVPSEFKESFQRLVPYMASGLRNNPQELEAVYLYLKLGGEKLARIAIDAFNQTHRLRNAQIQKKRLEQALLAELMEQAEEEEEESAEEGQSDSEEDEAGNSGDDEDLDEDEF